MERSSKVDIKKWCLYYVGLYASDYMFPFCRGVSCCKYCEVGVTFAFLCLPEDALGRLDSRFSLTICLLMTRTASPVLKAPFYHRDTDNSSR